MQITIQKEDQIVMVLENQIRVRCKHQPCKSYKLYTFSEYDDLCFRLNTWQPLVCVRHQEARASRTREPVHHIYKTFDD